MTGRTPADLAATVREFLHDSPNSMIHQAHAALDELAARATQAEADLRMVWRIATRGVGADTTPEEALATIATYVENKQRARRMQP